MSQQQFVDNLKKSVECANSALDQIYTKLSKCGDNPKTKSGVSYNAIHSICMAIKDNSKYCDIYTDAIEKLAPNISEHHWNMFVELLRFIFGEFYKKNLFQNATRLVPLAAANRIANAADIKSQLKLYSRQLYYGHSHMSEEEIQDTFNSLTVLLVKCKEIQFDELISEYHTHFIGFPSMVASVLVKHMDKASAMFDKLFAAIKAVKIPRTELSELFIVLMKYLIHFIYMDIQNQNSVLSQNFLRSCKENESLKEHKYQSYAINLFYYLVKLLLFPNSSDFNRNFVDIIGKFSTFFDRSELASETWFMDTIVTLTRILDAFKGQTTVLQALTAETYLELFGLIEKLMKMAHGVSYENGLWTCCKSVRKHIIFKLCITELVMFEVVVEQRFAKAELGTSVYTILKHAVAVAEFFNCSTVNYEIAVIMNALTRCAQNVKTKDHADEVAKMLLLTTKAKAYLPENSVRSLAKCLLHVYKIAENTQGQAEACAVYISHLIDVKADTDLIRRYIAVFYSLQPCVSILECLDSSDFPLKPEGFSRRLLHSMETGVFCKMKDNNILAMTSLLKNAMTTLDFVLVARQCTQVSTGTALERKYGELKAKADPTPVDHLTLGHICKIRAIQQMEKLKNIFSVAKISDESLIHISDPSKLKLMDVTAEMSIMNLAKEGVEAFRKFFETASQQTLSEEDLFVDWDAVIDDTAMLARLFHFRGYLDYAYISWKLLYQISTHLDDVVNKIRALSFICDECLFVEMYDPDFNLEAEIKRCDKGIFECLMNMEFLTPRKQNYVLTCLCYVAWYFAQKDHMEESQLLLELAQSKLEEIVERQNKFELVKATVAAVCFRVKWKLQKGLSQRSAFCHVDKILEEIRSIVYYTSEDSLNFPTLLFGIVNDLSEFTTNRLCEPATIPYVQMVLKLALDAGAAYRVIQLLVLWTHINLQSENVNKCQIKLDLIDILFRNAQTPEYNQKLNIKQLQLMYDQGAVEPYEIYGEEVVRKAAHVNPVSPVRIKYKPPAIVRDLESFLINHEKRCSCDKCSHAFLKWQFFRVGCLNARLLYLGDVYKETDSFYSKAINWCTDNIHKSHNKFHFRDYELSMLIQYVNLLRRKENFDTALKICEDFRELYNKFKKSFDGVFEINLAIQMESALSQKQESTIVLVSSARRSLKFSLPEEKLGQLQSTAKRRGKPKKESPKTIKENMEHIIYKDMTATVAATKTPKEKTASRKESTKNVIEEICKTVERVHIDEVLPKEEPVTIASSNRRRVKTAEKVHIEEALPNEETPTVVSSSRRRVKQAEEKVDEEEPVVPSSRRRPKPNLNSAIIIVDDDESPPPSQTLKVPKTCSKAECTPKTRGSRRKIPPSTVGVVKSGEADGRSKLLLRRRI